MSCKLESFVVFFKVIIKSNRPRLAALTKLSLSRAQNIVMPSFVLLFPNSPLHFVALVISKDLKGTAFASFSNLEHDFVDNKTKISCALITVILPIEFNLFISPYI